MNTCMESVVKFNSFYILFAISEHNHASIRDIDTKNVYILYSSLT